MVLTVIAYVVFLKFTELKHIFLQNKCTNDIYILE